MAFVRSFPPLVAENTRVLILGSMPGVKSLAHRQYYGNPRNHFWRLMFALFREPFEVDYERRVDWLLAKGVGLWDVLASCHRQGSLDAAIQEEQVNDLPALFRAYPGIRFLGFNGTKAFTSYQRQIGFADFPHFVWERLPSTSPIPRKHIRGLPDLVAPWQAIVHYLEETVPAEDM